LGVIDASFNVANCKVDVPLHKIDADFNLIISFKTNVLDVEVLFENFNHSNYIHEPE
jgi:hypothetical protein